MNNSTISHFTSVCLKTVGTILVISSLLDYIALAIPFQPLDSQWQISFTSQIVDRGIVPMVGMAFILVASWIQSTVSNSSQKSGFDIKLPAFFLSMFLGVIFLILVPLHVNNLMIAKSDALTQIEARATEAETKISEQYNQLNDIVQNPQRLQQLEGRIQEIDTAISSGKFQGQQLSPPQINSLEESRLQLQNFRDLAKNPEALAARLQELQIQLKDQKLEREKTAKTETLKQGVRTGLSSLMLAIGYLLIGWLGLKANGESKSSPKKAPAAR
ncbi:MAG: HpsJ family protein [Pleurocapsa sp.]